MANLFRAFFFKLKKDMTFRITLIVGGGLAILMMLLYMLIDSQTIGHGKHLFCTGNNLFVSSFSPVQNYGLAIPINLITFVVLEFSNGIIRNKIITGNSKFKIYLSLFLTGLVFTLSLVFTYVGLCTLLGTIVGGFNPNGVGSVGVSQALLTPDYIYKFFITAVLIYVTMTAFIVFFATLLRNVGPCIPICIVTPMILCFVLPTIITALPNGKELAEISSYLNPFHVFASPEIQGGGVASISNSMMIATTISNLFWTAVFTGFGTLIFVKRDVK